MQSRRGPRDCWSIRRQPRRRTTTALAVERERVVGHEVIRVHEPGVREVGSLSEGLPIAVRHTGVEDRDCHALAARAMTGAEICPRLRCVDPAGPEEVPLHLRPSPGGSPGRPWIVGGPGPRRVGDVIGHGVGDAWLGAQPGGRLLDGHALWHAHDPLAGRRRRAALAHAHAGRRGSWRPPPCRRTCSRPPPAPARSPAQPTDAPWRPRLVSARGQLRPRRERQ